jgi:hypothetical protein
MFLLTIMGLIVIVPPVVTLFNHDAAFLGMPQIVVYLFSIWLLLILGTVALTHFLAPDRIRQDEEGGD